MVVPCGKCPDCRQRRVQSWVFRLQQQEKLHSSSVFATLTYAPEHLPRTKNGFRTLVKEDVQKFFKRLRKNTGKKTIRYYACGEYGANTWRPHYHAIIFDTDFDEVYKAWGKGEIYIGDTTSESIAYVLKYMCKASKVPAHSKDDRLREFSLMSKKMGANYMSGPVRKFFTSSQNSFVILPDGYKQALPRYYRDRMFTEKERDAMNKKAAQKHQENYDKAVKDAGGIAAYYSNRHAAIKAAMEKFANDKLNQKRNKL